jgi:N-acetylglucosamine-6-phosphate deacetylase
MWLAWLERVGIRHRVRREDALLCQQRPEAHHADAIRARGQELTAGLQDLVFDGVHGLLFNERFSRLGFAERCEALPN